MADGPRVLSVFFLACACLGGCASAGSVPKAPTVFETQPVVITPRDDTRPTEAFEQALHRFENGDPAGAAALFDQVWHGEEAGTLAAIALYDAGIAWERAGDRERALQRFQDAVRRFGASEVGKLAALRATRLLARLERWSALSTTADLLIGRADLTEVERLEAYGAKALSILEVGDPDAAERYVAQGRDLVESLGLGEGGKLPLEVAQITFALGELRRLRSERIRFVPLPADFAAVLEARCQGLLDAQSAYTDAMRSYDPHWAMVAGYRVGELYSRLYRDLIEIPTPRSADTADKRRLFQGAMRLRYRVLLEKGLKMINHTLALAEKTKEASGWVDRVSAAKESIERALREQKAVLATLPYTEADLERALRDLAQSKGGEL